MARYSHLEFADSIPSEESYIFDAIRAYSSSDEVSHRQGLARQIHRDLDSRLVAHTTTFPPPPTAQDTGRTRQPQQQQQQQPQPCRQPRYLREKETSSPGWHPYTANNSRILSVNEGRAIVAAPQDESLKPNFFDVLHLRKPTTSLNDTDKASKPSYWPEQDCPANPVYPAFPPPIRSPTPPGLPTFGTPEAVNYSSQFQVRSATVGDSQNSQAASGSSSRFYDGGGASGRTRTASYGDKIRRIFSFTSSTPPQPQQQAPTVARAEDGTAVQGRFPYRQSGHGVGVVRRMEDHAFHQRALSPALEENTPDLSSLTQDRKLKREQSNSPQREVPWRMTPAYVGPVASHHSARGRFSSVSRLPAHDSLQRPGSANTGYTTSRVESFYTCASQLLRPAPSRQPLSTVNDQACEIAPQEPVACSLIPTESPTTSARPDPCVLACNPSGSWLKLLSIGHSCLSCCLGVGNDPDSAVYSNTSSRETYETARSHTSNEIAVEPDREDEAAEAPNSAPRTIQWFSEAWKSVHEYALRNVGTIGQILD
ncbi:uncharacterized protein BO95DRAFT_419155 [Aspergillus brunneoviolaceus CBS 621.78]|uniref:Uncharacterized protein n=1 Tax=Aspergillus brunneoviolaceus CBS 621.78 TaxID=1450534 RepID=A0ACD1G2C1_9EURO|nr:hypothetical protein BO95DRAFT_419155 [Aspergillus brunneoviolaceus CBS 621.78]RAH43323.1 hypothetical protein BO95DRAFT_419155 [Aspergillus brunneoviolaceus CBS 621.78]